MFVVQLIHTECIQTFFVNKQWFYNFSLKNFRNPPPREHSGGAPLDTDKLHLGANEAAGILPGRWAVTTLFLHAIPCPRPLLGVRALDGRPAAGAVDGCLAAGCSAVTV